MISLKRPHFSLYDCVFFPAVAQILAGRLDSCFLTHIKKYMTPIHALIFEKHVKMCVYGRHIKKPDRVNSLRFWGSTHSKNKLAGRSFFQNLGSKGPGHVSPGGSSRAAPSTFFAACSEASGGFNCVSKVLLKSRCKHMAFGRRKSNHTLARCPFFYQHCFAKIIET